MSDRVIDITPNNEPKPSFIKRIINKIGRYIGVTIAFVIMLGLGGWALFGLLAWLWPLILLVGGIFLFICCYIVVDNFFAKRKLLDLETTTETKTETTAGNPSQEN